MWMPDEADFHIKPNYFPWAGCSSNKGHLKWIQPKIKGKLTQPPLQIQIYTLENCWQAYLQCSHIVKFPVSPELTFHLVAFVLRITPSLYPHAASRRGSQTITRSFFRMDVHASFGTGRVPQKVGQFNYMDALLSPPFSASRPIHNMHCASAVSPCLPCFPGE